jgi:DNA polymerase III epsilon subunit-like protein
MYLHQLEKDEKDHFLALARRLAEIDDQRIDARERYMLNYMCAEMGVDPATADAAVYDEEALVKVFYRGQARRVLMLEAIGVCYANGVIHPQQEKLLRQLAAKFFLGDDFFEQALSLVKRQLELMADFDAFLED